MKLVAIKLYAPHGTVIGFCVGDYVSAGSLSYGSFGKPTSAVMQEGIIEVSSISMPIDLKDIFVVNFKDGKSIEFAGMPYCAEYE